MFSVVKIYVKIQIDKDMWVRVLSRKATGIVLMYLLIKILMIELYIDIGTIEDTCICKNTLSPAR